MRFSIVALALATVVAAYPKADPQFEEIGPAPSRLPISVPAIRPTPTRRRKHKEPTPTFKKSICECPKPIVPINQFTSSEKCEFEYAHSMACYFRAQGGCPSPTLACSK